LKLQSCTNALNDRGQDFIDIDRLALGRRGRNKHDAAGPPAKEAAAAHDMPGAALEDADLAACVDRQDVKATQAAGTVVQPMQIGCAEACVDASQLPAIHGQFRYDDLEYHLADV
jgi:hypothetical protein